MINRCQRNERGLAAGKMAQMALVSRRVEWRSSTPVRGWLNTYARLTLTDLVTGQFTVESLIANTLLDRPGNPMLFHAGD